MNYYNEWDQKIAAWLRGLIAAGLIPDGRVDTRSIADVTAGDLAGFRQCHFFTGIGGWSLALRLAGWPADRPVWTGSCPCQPFSAAGKGKGADDERHLWPEFYRLIRECRPDTVFGEQVENAIGKGWLDGVCGDLEGEGYAVGSVVLGAHSVHAPHIRQRLYWVADSANVGLSWRAGSGEPRGIAGAAHGGGVVLADGDGRSPGQSATEAAGYGRAAESAGGGDCGLADSAMHAGPEHEHESRGGLRRTAGPCDSAECGGDSGRVGNATSGEQRRARESGEGIGWDGKDRGSGAWDHSRLIQCRDNKFRRIPVEPEVFPLAPGVSSKRMGEVRARLAGMGLGPKQIKRALKRPGSILAMAGKHRTGVLHGAGNAIVPQVAAQFIKAFLG